MNLKDKERLLQIREMVGNLEYNGDLIHNVIVRTTWLWCRKFEQYMIIIICYVEVKS